MGRIIVVELMMVLGLIGFAALSVAATLVHITNYGKAVDNA